jgi:major membrane immunogen (membrane-anchored lipoprotein)
MNKLICLAAALLLTACGEVDQSLGRATGAGSDATAHAGTGKAYMESGWTPGDKASWESKLKARAQYGQNEYSRTR